MDALNRINRVLSDDNIRSFSTSLKNVEAITSEFEARKGMLEQLEQALTRANSAIAEWEALGASGRRLVETDGREAIANINAATSDARQAIASINRTATALERPVGEFADTGLPQLTEAIGTLNEAAASLQELVDEVRSSPRELIARPESKEMEVRP